MYYFGVPFKMLSSFIVDKHTVTYVLKSNGIVKMMNFNTKKKRSLLTFSVANHSYTS